MQSPSRMIHAGEVVTYVDALGAESLATVTRIHQPPQGVLTALDLYIDGEAGDRTFVTPEATKAKGCAFWKLPANVTDAPIYATGFPEPIPEVFATPTPPAFVDVPDFIPDAVSDVAVVRSEELLTGDMAPGSPDFVRSGDGV